MGLLDIKRYMQQVKMASLKGLSLHFNREPQLLRQLLQVWMRKGCIKQCKRTDRCGTSCGKCDVLLTEIYEWVSCSR
jgi:putative ferrous iron transport protein C